MFKNVLLGAIALLLAMTGLSVAMEMKIGDLTISNPTIRATVPGAKVAAGYVMITNNGASSDRIVDGGAEFAGKLELHEMKMVDQVVKMRPLANGIELSPGKTVMLKPGGNHIMFMKLDGVLKEGEMRPVMLEFEKAGQLTLNFHVKSIGDTMKMKHNHYAQD